MKKNFILLFSIILFPLLIVNGYSSWIILGEEKIEVANSALDSVSAKVAFLTSDTSKIYTKIEKALEVANSSSSSETVVVIPGSNPTINNNCTINSNVSLILPYSWDDSSFGYTYNGRQNGSPGDSDELYLNDVGGNFSDHSSFENAYLANSVTINDGVKVTVNGGNIKIGGVTGHEGQYLAGQTSGLYSQILMNPNSRIDIINNGTIETLGYIKENYKNLTNLSEGNGSIIDIQSGTMKSPFVVYDFNGGTNTVGVYVGKNGPVSPFSEFDLPNVHPKIMCYSSSSIIGLAGIYTDSKTIAS